MAYALLIEQGKRENLNFLLTRVDGKSRKGT